MLRSLSIGYGLWRRKELTTKSKRKKKLEAFPMKCASTGSNKMVTKTTSSWTQSEMHPVHVKRIKLDLIWEGSCLTLGVQNCSGHKCVLCIWDQLTALFHHKMFMVRILDIMEPEGKNLRRNVIRFCRSPNITELPNGK